MYTTRIAQIYDFRAKSCLLFVLFPLVDMGYTEGFFIKRNKIQDGRSF